MCARSLHHSDGSIDASEVRHILNYCGEECDAQQCEAMVNEFDEDGDKKIDLGEFTRAMQNRKDIFSKIVASVSCGVSAF